MKKNKYIGSDFDIFLKEENILDETEALAIKRVIAYQLEKAMVQQKLNQTEMSKRLKTSRARSEVEKKEARYYRASFKF